MPIFRFLDVGVLGGGNGVRSTCCRLHWVVRIWAMFTFCRGGDVFIFFGPMHSRSLRLQLVTEDSVDASCPSEIDREFLCAAISHSTFVVPTPCDTMESLSRYQLFSSELSNYKKKFFVNIMKQLMTFLRTCFLTSSHARKWKSTFTKCVQELRTCNTTCIVPCLWSWECHELRGYLVLEQCLWHPEKYLGTPCRRCLENIMPSVSPCFGDWLKNIHQHRLNQWTFFLFFVCRLIWFSLHSEINTRGLCFCHCYDATGFSRLIPCVVALDFLSFQKIELCERLMSVTCAGLASFKNFRLRILSARFHNFYQRILWHGVVQNNREAAGDIKCQSSALCDLQVKCVHCIEIWSF